MKKKSIYYSLTWVSVLLVVLGAIFLVVALGMQLIPIGPESFRYQINGVYQPYNANSLQVFRYIFLASFGLPGLILFGFGFGLLIYQKIKEKRAQELKQGGKEILCHQLELAYSSVQVNRQYKSYLTCIHTDKKGQTFIFKSRLLRYDPRPFLDDSVKVYYDRQDMRRYFVDIEGSMGDVFEL